MKSFTIFSLFFFFVQSATAQIGPEITSWKINTTGVTGYNNIPADVQQVRYSAGSVYVKSTNIPSFTIGPWPGNPNTASNQNWTFKITRTPQEQTGTKTATPLGHIGLWRNGVVFFNAKDAMSYNNQNIWHQNAVVVEAPSFDACKGHPQQQGAYHNHQNPSCLYTPNPLQHSGIVGYAFDSYPVYGPYAYANANGTGGIVRMRTSYRQRTITLRTTLPDGTILPSTQYGPPVNATFPLGHYIEDFEYVAALGTLDQYNGRTCVTPEYPSGTYAYFITIDSAGNSAYPYILGPEYYGVLVPGNTGAGSGHITITETTMVYTPPTAVGENSHAPREFALEQNYPNPFNPSTHIAFSVQGSGFTTLRVYDVLGREVSTLVQTYLEPGFYKTSWDAANLPSGMYIYTLRSGNSAASKKLLHLK